MFKKLRKASLASAKKAKEQQQIEEATTLKKDGK